MEEVSVVGVEDLVQGVESTAAVSHQGDVVRVSAEFCDVGSDPAQGQLLVKEGAVTADPVPVDHVEVPKQPDPVGDRDHDDVLFGEVGAVVDGGCAGSAVAAVEEDEHRFLGLQIGGPDVDAQGVLALDVLPRLPFPSRLDVLQEETHECGRHVLGEAVSFS